MRNWQRVLVKIQASKRMTGRLTALFLILLMLTSVVQTIALPMVANAQMEMLQKPQAKPNAHSQQFPDDPRLVKPTYKLANGVEDPKLAPVSEQAKETAATEPMRTVKKPSGAEKGKELTDQRTAQSRTYANKKGGEITEVTSMPQTYKSGNKLEAISNSLSEDTAYAAANKVSENLMERILPGTKQPVAFVAENGSIKAHFETIGTGGIRFVLDGKELKLEPQNANPSRPQKEQDDNGNTYIKYENVWDDVDLVYEYHGVTVKENIILKNNKARNSFAFKVTGAPVRNSADKTEVLVGGTFEGRLKFGSVSVQAGKRGVVDAPVSQRAANSSNITVEVGKDWLKKQGKDSFPMVIDPAPVDMYGIPGGAQGQYRSYKSDGYNCDWTNCPINVGGLNDAGPKYWRSMMRLPFDNANGRQFMGADIYLPMSTNPNWWNGTYDTRTVWVTWAPCFGYGCNNGGAPVVSGQVSSSGQFNISPVVEWMINNNQWGGWLMVWGEETTSSFKRFDAANVRLILYTNRHPAQPAPQLPSGNPNAEATVTSNVPQLMVSKVYDPDGDNVHYQFTLSSISGSVLWQSDATPSRQTILPEGLLQDGSRYKWSYRYAEHAGGNSYYWISGDVHGGSFMVALPNEAGKDKNQTFDEVGPVGLSLNTGKAYLSAGTHSMAALGGDIGLNLDYSSPLSSKPGLLAEYRALGATDIQYRRIEPNINHDWDLGSPAPGVIPTDNYEAFWSGYFVAPFTGDYYFGGSNDDDFMVWVDNPYGTVVNNNCCSNVGWSDTPVSLERGQSIAISVIHTEYGGGSRAQLWVRGAVVEQVVPTEWLRTAPMPADSAQGVNGLTGHYYYDDGSHNPTEADKYLVRQDPNVNFSWGEGAPASGLPVDNFYTRWEGYFTAPTTGSYAFGVGGDDGIKVTVDGIERAGLWYPHGYEELYDPNPMFLTGGQTVPIIVEFFEGGGAATAKLLMEGPTGRGVVDGKYLTTAAPTLTRGWTVSADPDGTLAYERLSVRQNGDVVLYDGNGAPQIFASTGTGYRPPVDQDALLVRGSDGTYNLTGSDGRTYVFNADGTLKLTSIPVDDAKPAALQYEYSTQNGAPKLKRIIDAVNPARFGILHYSGDGTCRAPIEDYDVTPAPGLLCGFETSDGRYTQLMYYEGKLEIVRAPGEEDTKMYYDYHGMVGGIRDPLATDLRRAELIPPEHESFTRLEYDDTARVKSISPPTAKIDDTIATHTFEYFPAVNGLLAAAQSHVDGLPEPYGFQQYAEFDNQYRTVRACDNLNNCSTTEFDPIKDIVLSTNNHMSQKTTFLYDDEDRPTHIYGPAREEWFGADRRPLAEHAAKVPHSEGRFDEGIKGPEATYYSYYTGDTSSPAGGVLIKAPKLHATGINANTGLLDRTWAAAPIASEAGMHGWGVRLTGKVRLPASGTYAITVQHTEGVKLWLDDTLAVNAWADGPNRTEPEYTFTYTAGQPPIRFALDHYNKYGVASPTLKVSIRQVGGFAATTNWGSYLTPSYGLNTSSTVYDAQLGDAHTKTTYTNAALGIIGNTAVDPTGLNYQTSAGYEAVGSGFLRQTSKTSAGGSVTTYQNYGALDTRDNPCTSGVTEAHKQAGFPKHRIDVDPDGAGATAARKTEVIYDDAGREIAFRIGTEAWTCTTYDARGRVTKIVIPTVSGRAGRTITYTYNVNGDPRITQIGDANGTTTETVDLLGRTVTFQDAKGNVTDTYINSWGQITGRYNSSMGLQSMEYDDYGRPTRMLLDNEPLAEIEYDAHSLLYAVNYPRITDPATGRVLRLYLGWRDDSNRLAGLYYRLPNNQEILNGVTYSQSGVVIDETVNDIDLSPGTQGYTYDKMGRLTQANIAGHTYGYDFTAADAACAGKANNFANAGKNSNRLRSTIDGVATWYCYDGADRLIASSDAKFDAPTYDNHGNTLTLGTGTSATTFKYDQSDRNTEILQGTTLKVTYKRDHDNRITQRQVLKNGTTSTYHYGSTGGSDYTFMYTNATTKAAVEKYITLPGGVMLTIRPNEAQVANKTRASLPNMRGSTLAVLNGTGTNLTGVMLYDPFGGQIAPTAAYASANPGIPFATATTAADNQRGDQTATWAGQNRRSKETVFPINPMQMGARVYIPGLGRFTGVDPVDGGTLNNYVYVLDPINTSDYSGQFAFAIPIAIWGGGAAAGAVAQFIGGALVIGGAAVTGWVVGSAIRDSRSEVAPVSSPASTGSSKPSSSSGGPKGGSSPAPGNPNPSPKPPIRSPKGVKKAAEAIRKAIKMDSPKINTPSGQYRFDLAGRAHHNKPSNYAKPDRNGPFMGRKVETPHKTFTPNNPNNPNTGLGREGPAKPLDWDDINTLKNHFGL
jgi:RHS repeat-associated protein